MSFSRDLLIFSLLYDWDINVEMFFSLCFSTIFYISSTTFWKSYSNFLTFTSKILLNFSFFLCMTNSFHTFTISEWSCSLFTKITIIFSINLKLKITDKLSLNKKSEWHTKTYYLSILLWEFNPSAVQTLKVLEFDPIANKSPDGWNAIALIACTSSRVATV